MKKTLIIAVLSFCLSNIAQAQMQTQTSFSLSIAGPGGWISMNNYPQIGYPFVIYQQPFLVPYIRQPVQVPINVIICQDNYMTDSFGNFLRDQFGNFLTQRKCWNEWRWQ